jgi:hypothetical protein
MDLFDPGFDPVVVFGEFCVFLDENAPLSSSSGWFCFHDLVSFVIRLSPCIGVSTLARGEGVYRDAEVLLFLWCGAGLVGRVGYREDVGGGLGVISERWVVKRRW